MGATSPSPWPRRALMAASALAILAGIGLRLWRLGVAGLTSDEAFSWRLTRYPVGEMLRRAGLDVHPPLYYLALEIWTRAAGDAPAPLRGLSVLCGLAAIALSLAVVAEAARLEDVPLPARGAAVLAAALVALHATQVAQSRNARMYALGTALALASAWVLLRARRGGTARWAAWGLAAAAAAATHYYLLFTIAAETAWAAAFRARPRPRARDLGVAAAVALATFAPWAIVFWRQARQVRAEYWIPALGAGDLAAGIARWALGADGGRAAPVLALAVVLSLAAAVRWGGRSGRLFALLAAAPWVFGFAVSALSGRPIVLDRYMLFAQVFLLCAWAVTVAAIPLPWARTAAGLLLLATLAAPTRSALRTWPADRPAMWSAARFLKRQADPRDLVVVESPRALNKLRYYARQEGGEALEIRSALPERVPLSPHVSHVVSLTEADVVAAGAAFDAGADTVWIGRESTSPPDAAPPGWAITYARIFEGGEESRFALARYGRRAPPP